MTICRVQGCGRKQTSKGVCERHRSQLRKYGRILERTKFDPNEIRVEGASAFLTIYNGRHEKSGIAIVDLCDLAKLSGIKISYHSVQRYPTVRINGKSIMLHIFLFGRAEPPFQWEHRNRNPFDNRRENLRLATQSQNLMNASIMRNNTSGYKGVYWNKIRRKWIAQGVIAPYKAKYIGAFDSIDEAVKARDSFARQVYGEFAFLNSEREVAKHDM